MLDKIWDVLVRWRNWFVAAIGGAMILLPELLSSPELLAVIPTGYHKWVYFGALMLGLAVRWRPATRAADPEVQAKKAADVEAKATGESVSLLIKSAGEKPVLVATVEPKAGGAK